MECGRSDLFHYGQPGGGDPQQGGSVRSSLYGGPARRTAAVIQQLHRIPAFPGGKAQQGFLRLGGVYDGYVMETGGVQRTAAVAAYRPMMVRPSSSARRRG